ncbi:MAG: YitT family protein [Alistipes sp.]
MIRIGKTSVFSIFKEYFLMTLGMCIYAFGWIGCILPAHCAGGGASGLSLLVYYLTGGAISIGMMVLILNAVLLLIAGFIVGWKFGIKTIFCVFVLSLSMSAMQEIFTLPDGTIMDVFHLDNRLLSSILGGIFSGIGVALCFMQGGSTGGTDIVAMIINKYRTVAYGKIVRMSDSVIIASALLTPQVGIDGVIYGFVMVAVFSYTVDMIMAGNQQSSQIFIICKDYVAMADAMNRVAHRGATVIDAVGWYSKNKVNIVMVVCRKREMHSLMKVVKSVDPDAFITAGSVMGVYGEGFDALNKL